MIPFMNMKNMKTGEIVYLQFISRCFAFSLMKHHIFQLKPSISHMYIFIQNLIIASLIISFMITSCHFSTKIEN